MDLEKIRHSASHVLAYAIKKLYPEVKLGIGPVIEDGFYYDFDNLNIKEEDLAKIEEAMKSIIKQNHKFKFKRVTRKEAQKLFKDESYKLELLRDLKDNEISVYESGDFIDLCKGPHVNSMNDIKTVKLLRIAGAYWRGDSKREMLTRIYAISYPDRKQLQDYLALLEEAKKRDHKLLGPRLDLFSLQEEAPGMPFIHPKGMIIWNALLAFWRELHQEAGYIEIKTPQLMSQELWERSGHWMYYRENMYAFSIEERNFAIKPMSCPGCMLYFKTKSHSYREFPLRIAEFGHVHRHEPSGALSGLFRVRSFHQDDAHLLMRPSNVMAEIFDLMALVEKIYIAFGLTY